MSDDVVDLDALLEEAHGLAKQVKFKDELWEFPPTLPLTVVTALEKHQDADEAMVALLGQDQGARILALGLSVEGLKILLEHVYPDVMGEASASSPPLNRAGRRARQTSKGSTDSISDKPAPIRQSA